MSRNKPTLLQAGIALAMLAAIVAVAWNHFDHIGYAIGALAAIRLARPI